MMCTLRHGGIRRGGSALIIVLWTIGLLSMLVLSFAFDAHLEGKIASSARKRRKAEHIALSGMAVAEMLLDHQTEVNVDAEPEDVENDKWYDPAVALKTGRGFSGLEIEVGEGKLRLDMEPEPGRRNVNKLTEDDWDRVLAVATESNANIPDDFFDELINSFFDWTDEDDSERDKGAESKYYEELDPPYRARNAPVDTVRELLLIKGFNEAILSGGPLNPDDPPESWIHVSGIQDMLTTYGDGKVNVNAAGRRVLMTLPFPDDEDAEEIANAIIEKREGRDPDEFFEEGDDSSFKSVEDFMSRVGNLPGSVSSLVTTSSDIYRVTAVGMVGRVTRRIWAIVQYGGAGRRVICWREEP